MRGVLIGTHTGIVLGDHVLVRLYRFELAQLF